MKKLMFRMFHVFMAVVVLMSSTGFGLIEHSCTLKGKTTSFHKSNTYCCAKHASKPTKPNQSQVKKSSCCSEEQKYENVEYSSSVSQLASKFVQSTVEAIKTITYDFLVKVLEIIYGNVSALNQDSKQPPHSGKEIRVLTQSFII